MLRRRSCATWRRGCAWLVVAVVLCAPATAHAQGQSSRPPDNVLGATDAVVAVHTSVANGAGFVLEGAGDQVVTHDGVVRSSDTARVTTIDGRELEGTVIGRDVEAGLAVLFVPGVRVGAIDFAEASAEEGDAVYAIGRPLGYSDRIAALEVDELSGELAGRRIELDGRISGDGLGGPLLDSQGNAVGVVIANPTEGARAVPLGRVSRVDLEAIGGSMPWMTIGAGLIVGLAVFVAFITWLTARSKRRWAQRMQEEPGA